jgi:type IV pilus assembly protein PilA
MLLPHVPQHPAEPTDWNEGRAANVTLKQPRGFKMKNQKGFTLIELMIVVAIIAILAAIAISQYQDYVIRSQVSEGSSLADGVKTAVGEFYNNRGHFPLNNASAGLAAPASIKGEYVSEVDISGTPGIIQALYNGGKANSNLSGNGGTLDFSAVPNAGSIEWHCQSAQLPQKWCPSSCECS